MITDELLSLRPNNTNIEEVEKRANEDLVISYLMGLGSNYDDLRNHILRNEPFPGASIGGNRRSRNITTYRPTFSGLLEEEL